MISTMNTLTRPQRFGYILSLLLLSTGWRRHRWMVFRITLEEVWASILPDVP
jgi:hypothetical protein